MGGFLHEPACSRQVFGSPPNNDFSCEWRHERHGAFEQSLTLKPEKRFGTPADAITQAASKNQDADALWFHSRSAIYRGHKRPIPCTARRAAHLTSLAASRAAGMLAG